MDIRMPVMDGLEATRTIVADEQLAGVRVIVLTTFELDEYVFEALRVGASGFLLKDIDPDDLRQAVRVVAGGDALLSPRVTRRLITRFVAHSAPRAVDPERLAVLTDREREVMALVAQGLSNEEIGQRLFMSPATAKTHVSRAMLKLGARDRAQLVVLAYQTDWSSRNRTKAATDDPQPADGCSAIPTGKQCNTLTPYRKAWLSLPVGVKTSTAQASGRDL
jgi:DNA-binding NarL/FixJ family response regulator